MAENKFNLTQTGQQVQSILNASKNTDQVLTEIQEAMADLPDGQAVSAQVALNTAAIEELSEKVGQGDGAYDISEANAVGGVLATYADLAAALGENGANIPADLRKGGMSIKFVQSSDNKYVQYRYMGTATTGSLNPFLDTANWQGVDEEPTINSRNLVESGGVFPIKEENIRQTTEIYDNVILKLAPVNIIQNSYLNNKGSVVTRQSGVINVYELPIGSIVSYNHSTGLQTSSICLYSDSSCTDLISVLFVGSDSANTSFYKNESGNILYIGFSSLYGYDVVKQYVIKQSLKSENIKGIIGDKSFDTKTFCDLFQYEEVKQSSTKLGSSYINSKGEIKSAGSEWNIFIFNVNEGEKYHIAGTTNNATFSVAFYSDLNISYENLVSIVPKETAAFDTIISVPKGAVALAMTNSYDYDNRHLAYKLNPIGTRTNIKFNQLQSQQLDQEFVRAACNTNEVTISGEVVNHYYINVNTGNPVYANTYNYRKYQITPGKMYHLSGSLGVSNVNIGIATYKTDDFSSDTFIRNIHSGTSAYDLYFRAKEDENYIAITDQYLVASNFVKEVYVVPNDSNRLILCWGDSLTYSNGSKLTYNFGYYPNKLQELLPNYEIINAGEGGDTCQTLLSRQQGLVVSEDFVLNADSTQQSTVIFNYGTPLQQPQVIDMINPCFIDGIACKITYSSGNYKIQRKTSGTSNRNIPKGTFITTNGLKNYNHPKVLVAFIGTNNGFTSAEAWRDMIIDTYEKIRIVSGCERMVVISTHKGIWDGGNVENLKVVEAGLFAKYGARYINWRLYASTNAIYDAGLTPTQADLDAMAAGWCPPQLMSDTVHLTQAGYEVLATYIYNRLVELGDVDI